MAHEENDAPGGSPSCCDPAGRATFGGCRCLFWAVVGVVLGWHLVLCTRAGWRDPGAGERGSDFTALYSAGELARRGENVYDYERSTTPRRPFIYPPLFAVFPMALLSLLPHNAALVVFWVLNVLLLFASLRLLRGVLWPSPCPLPQGEGKETVPLWRRPGTGLVLAVLICWRFLDSNMRLGNANMYILFLLTLTVYLLTRNRGLWAGLSVALATAFKVTPGLFGLYFLWSRRGRALAGGALGLALFLVLVPGGVLGFAPNWEMLRAFARHASGAVAGKGDKEAGESGGIVVGWKHQVRESHEEQAVGVSLRGAMQRLLSPSVALNRRERYEDRTINVLNLSFAQAARVSDVLSLVLLAITIALTSRRWAREGHYALALSLGLVTSAMTLISPLTRKAHLVVLLIPVAALIALLQQDRLTGAARRWAWAALLLLGLHGVVFSGGIIGQRASELVQAAGATTLSVLLLYVATAVALRTFKGATGAPLSVRHVSGQCEASSSSCS